MNNERAEPNLFHRQIFGCAAVDGRRRLHAQRHAVCQKVFVFVFFRTPTSRCGCHGKGATSMLLLILINYIAYIIED